VNKIKKSLVINCEAKRNAERKRIEQYIGMYEEVNLKKLQCNGRWLS
jgi:hypothetical protein